DEAFKDVYHRPLDDEVHGWGGALIRSSGAAMAAKSARSGKAVSPAEGASPPEDDAYTRGLEAMRRREDAAAVTLMEEPPPRRPDDPAALWALGRLHFRHGDFDAARTRAVAALATCAAAPRDACRETDAWSHLTLGRIEAVRGRHIAA